MLLTLVGSVDLVSKDELISTGQRALEGGGCTQLTLDLAGVTFMDSSGLGALITLDNDAETRQTAFAVRNPSARVERLLTLTGLADRYLRQP